MENAKQNSTDHNSYKNLKKQYIIKKYKDKSDLIKVKECFSNPNEFLKKQKMINIGHISSQFLNYKKSFNKLKSSSFSNILCLSPLNNAQKNEEKLKNNFYPKSKSLILNSDIKSTTYGKTKFFRNYSCKNNFNSKSNTYLNHLENTDEKYDTNFHYKIKSMGNIIKIFKQYKYLEEQNKDKKNCFVFGDNKLPEEIKKEIGKNLSGQEKALLHLEKCKNNSQILSKNISNRINRKEDDLLYNKLEIYRLKKQLVDLMEKSKSIRDKFGDNYWMVSLRRPKISKEIRFLYSNLNHKYNLSPDLIIDSGDKEFEFISAPSLQNNKEYKDILKTINKIRKKYKFKIPDAENVLDIQVKGKNILHKELNDFKDNTNDKFRLFKDPTELNQKNMKNITCKESFDIKYKIQRNRAYTNEETKNQKILYKSKSQIGDFRINKKNNFNEKKQKETHMQKAYKLLMKDNKLRESSIKIVSYK